MPHDIQLRVLPHPSTGLDLALDIFITAKEAERCTPRTIQTYGWTLRRFLAWLQGEGVTDAQGITPHHIRRFLAKLDKQGRAASYIHIYARTVKTWLRFLYAEGLTPTDPMAKVAMPRLDKEILPAFAPEDVKKLLAACQTDRDKALVLCLLDTGCRAAEFVGPNVGDLDRKTGALAVRQGKGRKDRVTFLGGQSAPGAAQVPAGTARRRTGRPALSIGRHRRAANPQRAITALPAIGKAGRRGALPSAHLPAHLRPPVTAGRHEHLRLAANHGAQRPDHVAQVSALVEEDLADAHRKHGAVDNML